MSLDNPLRTLQRTVPECVAAGVVDITSGMLLAVRTVDSHPQDVLDLVAAATGELFQGENVTAIEDTFKRIRGINDPDLHYFREIVIFSENLLHLFQRCKRHSNMVVVVVCRKKANLGMVMVKARGQIDDIERAL
ncbi:MAG: hypothetical protein AAF799_48300 [Myxococcota bacterium]